MAILLDEDDLETLLHPYILPSTIVPPNLYLNLAAYLELLLKWNAKTNLSAIRDPAEIVTRHFGESLFAAQHLANCGTLLDFGSGAGFPGLPMQLIYPDLVVTVSESQNKKVAFLREVIRSLHMKTNVWPGRVEAMAESVRFDIVTLRAVDNMGAAIAEAGRRAVHKMMVLSTGRAEPKVEGWSTRENIAIPKSTDSRIFTFERTA